MKPYGEGQAPVIRASSAGTAGRLPQAVDVAVIGAGIVGLCTARELARHGLRVAVFEKGYVAGEQSSRNWGWVRTLSRDVRELPLAALSDRAWLALQAEVEVGYRRTGLAYLADSDEQLARYAQWRDTAREHGFSAGLLDHAGLSQLIAGGRGAWRGALYSASDGVAEPSLACAAIAALAERAGVSIHEYCAVRGLDIAAGRVSGIVTELGRVRCDAAVLAGGAWSRLFLGNHGVDFAQLRVRASAMRTKPLAAGVDLTLNASGFTCRKRADGGYTISQAGTSIADLTPDSLRLFRQFLPAWLAERKYLKLRVGARFIEEWRTPRRFALDAPTPFEACRTLDPAPATGTLAGALRNLEAAFPNFRGVQVERAWAGMIDVTPDALPVIAPLARLPGLHLASGFSAHGFGIGPGAGLLMADLVRGVAPRVDPSVFRLERLAR